MNGVNLDQMSATEIISHFSLTPLEGEGGHWAPLYRSEYGNAILFLVVAPDFSAWHRIPEDELWVHLAGAPLDLHVIDGIPRRMRLSRDTQDQISYTVSAQTWMAARSTGEWSLVVCSLAPPFSSMTLATYQDVEKWRKDFPESGDLLEGLLHE